MKRTAIALFVLALPALTVGLQSQQKEYPQWMLPTEVTREFPESPGEKTLPGSTQKFTEAVIDHPQTAPDWYPNEHPPAPSIVTDGKEGTRACGSCHLMSGIGHPESSDLTGLTAEYMMQQLRDFKAETRIDPTRMNGIAKTLTDAEMKEASDYFAQLPRIPSTKVVEAAMVPKTFLGNGRMRFVEPGGEMEPIGNRIIVVPENQETARLRDPKNVFINYVPPGSLAKGKELVETGGGKTVACGICHGEGMKGAGNIPRLSGMHPIYTMRQLVWFKDGTRNGADAGLMKPIADALTEEDMIAISAYLGSLAP